MHMHMHMRMHMHMHMHMRMHMRMQVESYLLEKSRVTSQQPGGPTSASQCTDRPFPPSLP